MTERPHNHARFVDGCLLTELPVGSLDHARLHARCGSLIAHLKELVEHWRELSLQAPQPVCIDGGAEYGDAHQECWCDCLSCRRLWPDNILGDLVHAQRDDVETTLQEFSADELRTAARKVLPTIDEMAGSDPDFTGGLSTAEYIRELRGDA